MTELTCAQAQEMAPEYGLGILATDEMAAVAAHLLRCQDCRRDAAAFAELADGLTEIIPAAEPPPGFDRRVLASLPPTRRARRTRTLGALGAALVAAALIVGVVLAGGPDRPATIHGQLRSQGRTVGSVYTEGRPPWVWMSVEHAGASGIVSCELVQADGVVVRLGSFDLVDGSGSWAAPEPSGLGPVRAARLISADGTVLAQAVLGT